MKWFPKEKHRIDFFAFATRKVENPWMAKFYLVVGIAFFGYAFYQIFFGG